MCGIIGYTGTRLAAPLLLEGLARLEYRGYDSAGIAVVTPEGELAVRKAPGKLRTLVQELEGGLPHGFTGIGHTRWATHGPPTKNNAPPHADCAGDVVVVHNGIVENYLELKRSLIQEGHRFTSDTDTETIAHLIEKALPKVGSLEEALRSAAGVLRGANAIVAMSRREPGTLVAVRLGNAGGITVGYAQDGMLLASDLPALIPHTRQLAFLADGEVVAITRHGARYSDLAGRVLEKGPQTVQLDPAAANKGGHRLSMLKEILEQAETVTSALRGRIAFDPPAVLLEEFPLTSQEVQELRRVVFVGMGTSYHACQVARLWVERLAGIPAEADNASEFRYRQPLLDRHTLVVAVGQSGETADTLAGMEEALHQGARLLTVCNVEGSQATRRAEGTLLMRAGLEIGVASTKTFTASLVTLYLLALYLAGQRGRMSPQDLLHHLERLTSLPNLLGQVVAQREVYRSLAQQYAQREHFLYLGRGISYPIAMEGALKLKEVSYIHAEGYAAGEMKHGPIALVDDRMPVVALALQDPLYDKMLANISEVKARGGTVIAIGTAGDADLAQRADHVLHIPATPELLSPMLSVVPLQLFAYELAVHRGCDVDQPRNLAKTVTVE